jgi:cation diffusion facilitator family transporter
VDLLTPVGAASVDLPLEWTLAQIRHATSFALSLSDCDSWMRCATIFHRANTNRHASLMTPQNPKTVVHSEKVAAARLSIYSNSLLTVLKLVVGALSGSVSVLSEAAHSASDLVASWIAFFSVRMADAPADEQHPYGHGKIESISGMAEAALIFGAAGFIIYEAANKLVHREGPEHVDLGLAAMLVSSIANMLIARHLFQVAKKTDSLALKADAEHLRTDVFTSAGVFVGLALVRFTGHAWIDPVAGLAVALLILKASWRLTREAFDPLLDAKLPDEDRTVVRNVLDEEPRVLGYHKLRTRKSGSYRYVDAHVQLDDDLSLLEAHDITEELEDRIRERLPHTEITLHTEPFRAELRHQYEQHGGPHPVSDDDADI